jgi:hypothetical protein
MQLSDLVGEHVLEIVPRVDIRHPIPGSDANGALFTLSGKTYLIFEDESDGYRSSAGPLLCFEGSAYVIGGGSFYPDYIHEAVLCSHVTKGEYGGQDDILEVRSKETGEVIFRVGTDNVDDYYPSFVCEWRPEGLSANARGRIAE